MNIKIKETGELETLELRDSRGINWALDLIGNHDGLNEEGGFWYDDMTGLYSVNQEDFNYWKKIVDDNQALEYRLEDLRKEHGSEAVDKTIMWIDTELEFRATVINKALDEAFEPVTV